MAENFELLNALLQKLAIVVMGPDSINNLKVPEGYFISFCTPGIAVDQSDFDFGFVAPEANKTSAAADFSSVANTVPPPQGRWMASDNKLDDVYGMILRDSIFPTVQLSAQEKKSLQAARDLLIHDVQTIDPANGGVVTRPADTPLFEAYKEREAIYLNAAADYRSLQVNFLYSDDPKAKTEWALKGPIFEKRLRAAYNSWVPVKDQVEKALAIIDTIGARGPELYWSGLKQRFERSKFSTPEGDQYYLTKYFPGKFWDDSHKGGWLKFTFGYNEVHEINESSSMNVGGGGSVSVGLWSIGASASYAEQREFFKADIANTALQVSLTVVPIRRSWFDASILKSRGWKFDPNINQNVLSDGGTPPKGLLPAYATAMILARDMKLSTDMSSEQNEHVATQFSASGSVGWGPFSVRGNYSRNTDRKTHDFVKNAAGLEAPGMQIIGYMCEYVGKLPNPDNNLNWG
jgi:hypothetical protein